MPESFITRLIGRNGTIDAEGETLELAGTLWTVSQDEHLPATKMSSLVSVLSHADAEALELGIPDEIVAARGEFERIDGAFGEVGRCHFPPRSVFRRKPIGSRWKPI